jgi:hypothetical protein
LCHYPEVMRRFATKDDPKDTLAKLRPLLDKVLVPKKDLDEWRQQSQSNAATGGSFNPSDKSLYRRYGVLTNTDEDGAAVRDLFRMFFIQTLQSYTLPPLLRKKAEAGARNYAKSIRPKLNGRSWHQRQIDMIEYMVKYQASLESDFKLAVEILKAAKPHSEDGPTATKLRVGAFTLINTGGFDRKTMDAVASVVKEAEQLLKGADVGEVCYGDIQVTKSLSRREVLAFYQFGTDEMYVRADTEHNTLITVLHELGHRYEHKFLKDKEAGLERIFNELEAKERARQRTLRQKAKEDLQPGKQFDFEGKHYTVLRNYYDEVVLERADKPGKQFRSKSDKLITMLVGRASEMLTDPNYEGFVSDYAGTKSRENFAEMFAHYVYGDLPVRQMGSFELLLFGTPKTANQRLARRVAARWVG